MKVTRRPKIVGVLNVSPESFYAGSVQTKKKSIEKAVLKLTKDGADIIDIGAMSSAPYRKTTISLDEEIRRLTRAIKMARNLTDCPFSADTWRAAAAEAALSAGAICINDITGLFGDPAMGSVAKRADGLILMAHPSICLPLKKANPVIETKTIFKKILERAQDNGIPLKNIVLDPGIGFFRDRAIAWWKWDLSILKELTSFKYTGRPLLVGVSRKSFLGEITGQKDPADRLPASLAATLVAAQNGAAYIRTHDVRETKQALQLWEALSPRQ